MDSDSRMPGRVRSHDAAGVAPGASGSGAYSGAGDGVSDNMPGISGRNAKHGTRMAAFKAAFPLTVPIALGFLFLGGSYGVLMGTKGFSFLWPMCMAVVIFAGSMEFVTVNLLLSAFNPIAAFALALMVNARHLFYGLAMLGKFKGLGWKRPYLIYGMCDETFAINSTVRIPEGVDRGWFYVWVTVLNQSYWVFGATLGGLVGSNLPFDTEGLDFVLTALFLVIFLDQWLGSHHREHVAALIGVLTSLACLALFGANNFMIPAMIAMLALFVALRPQLDDVRTPHGGSGATAGDDSGHYPVGSPRPDNHDDLDGTDKEAHIS